MKCPFCCADDTSVIDSRVSEDGQKIRRRRRCQACDKRFTTYETVELRLPQVVKHDGSRAEFDRNKLLTGFNVHSINALFPQVMWMRRSTVLYKNF